MTFLDPVKVTDDHLNNEEVDEMEETSTTTQTYNPQAGSRVQKLFCYSPPLPTGQNTRTKLDMSVAQAASSAQAALSAAISSSLPSESLAPSSEVDPPAPGPGDSGLAPIHTDTYAFDENLLSLLATSAVPGNSTPPPLPSRLITYKSPHSRIDKPDLKVFPILSAHSQEDLATGLAFLSLFYPPTLTPLYPSLRAPDSPGLPMRLPLTPPPGGGTPQKVMSITLMVDTILLNDEQKRFHDCCVLVYRDELPCDMWAVTGQPLS